MICFCGFLDQLKNDGVLVSLEGDLLYQGHDGVDVPIRRCPACRWTNRQNLVDISKAQAGIVCMFCGEKKFPETDKVFVSKKPETIVCFECVEDLHALTMRGGR